MNKQTFPALIALTATLLFVGSTMKNSGDDSYLLLNKKVPAIVALASNGQRIDTNYFKGKVTLISFMFIGCPPCMKEAPALNQLYKEVSPDTLQMLCIAPHTAAQMSDYNSDASNRFSLIRKANGVDPIPYPIVTECMLPKAGRAPNVVGPECNTLSSQFLVSGYPATLLVDRKGIIRHVYQGFSLDPTYAARFKARLKAAIKNAYLTAD